MSDQPRAMRTTTETSDHNDDAAEIRYSLTALGEALVADRDRKRFRGFGPCAVAMLEVAG